MKSVFSQVKDVQYGILITLLDNYIRLTLCSYSVLFKLNRFDEYYCAIFRQWIMFYCFHRKNYNKAPLVWLSNILFWKSGCSEIYNLFADYLIVFEYFVEQIVHSVARKSTSATDSVEQLRQKLFSIFAAGERLANFQAAFTPARNYVFTRRQLSYLYSSAAFCIVGVLVDIVNRPGQAHPLPRQPKQRKDLNMWSVPALFGIVSIKCDFMSLGFQFSPVP